MRLVESPRDRLREVTIGLISHRSGPNVLIGVFAGALLQWLAPDSAWFVLLTFCAWALSVVLYAIVDELVQRAREERDRLLEPESRYYGIE